MAGAGILTPVVVATLASTPAAAESLSPVVTGVSGPTGLATDPAGDIFVGDSSGNVNVWSTTSTTIFGTSVPADTLTPLFSVGTVDSLTYHTGDLWISDTAGVQVVSPTSTTIYGVAVTADTPATIVSSSSNITPWQVAFDTSDNLYFGDVATMAGQGTVDVLPVASGTLFGHSVTSNTPSPLVTGLNQPDGVAVDSSGNVYYADESADVVGVLSATSGSIFGTPVTADSPTELFAGYTGLGSPNGISGGPLAFDSSGNLYVDNLYTGVVVISNSSSTIFGTAVTDDTPTALNLELDAFGIAFDPSDDLLMADGEDNAVVSATTPTASISGVSITGSLDNPTITITGTGFGTAPPAVSPGCGATGNDYNYSVLTMSDLTQGYWEAGVPGDCVGFNITSYSSTQVVATFGSWYTDEEVGAGTQIHGGDRLIFGVAGSYVSETLPGVTSVQPASGPNSGATTVAITGSGFTGATAVDFGSDPASSFNVNTDTSITATAPAGSVGTVDVTVTTPVGTSPTSSADEYTYFSAVSANYSCTVPGDGTNTFPMAISESPVPPASEDAGASFQEALGAQVTVPSSVTSYYQGLGATTLTLESQSVTENGLASADGPASGAVNPSAETASATDVPQSFTPLPSAAVTYQTSYDPVTWQTGPGTGKVYLTPGDVDIVITYVVSGTPTTATISCTPPATVGTLGTTTVDTAPVTPTYQVPTSTPPVQSQVTAGSDDGWSFTVANTSQSTVKGLQTKVTIGDGNPTPPTFDTSGITASGTKGCAVTSPGVLTCTENNLAAGASDTVNVLVDTAGLSSGTSFTGTAAVTSANAGSASDSLDQFTLVTVTNGSETVAVPGIAATSSTAPLSQTGGDVILTLPKAKIPKAGPMEPAVVSEAKGATGEPPVVGVTLKSLPASDEPALCPPAHGGCPGDVIEVEGNFSAYVSQVHPVSAVIQIFYGASVPANLHMYMLEFKGSVVELPACAKSSGHFNTPCVKGKEKTIGSAGSLSSQDTVLFTGDDPGFSRR